jgi:hypothetical protein
MMFGFKPKAQFTVDNEKEISTAPKWISALHRPPHLRSQHRPQPYRRR